MWIPVRLAVYMSIQLPGTAATQTDFYNLVLIHPTTPKTPTPEVAIFHIEPFGIDRVRNGRAAIHSIACDKTESLGVSTATHGSELNQNLDSEQKKGLRNNTLIRTTTCG